MTLAPPPAAPSTPVEVDDLIEDGAIEDGVIEEARRRQRRRRRTAGIALGGAAVALALAALSIGGGRSGKPGAPGEPSAGRPLKLTLVHGRAFSGGQPALMGVAPSLQAGNVGVCVRVSGEDCNGPLPSAADPVYGGEGGFNPEEKVGPAGEIDAIFTGPRVAAMRVAHLGTFRAQSAPGLPPGAKQIVFYRPPGSRGTVLAPGLSAGVLGGSQRVRRAPALSETLLDASGHPIAVGKAPTFQLPNSYWQWPQAPPAQGRCAMRSSLAGAHFAWGMVATRIAADPAITTPGWLSCLHTWFSLGGASYETAILLNAHSPGSPPAMLWGAVPLAGHSGILEIPAVEREIHLRIPKRSPAQVAREIAADAKRVGRARAVEDVRPAEQLAGEATFRDVFIPPTLARRVGPAWVLVRYGNSLAGRIAFLQALHVTRIALPSG